MGSVKKNHQILSGILVVLIMALACSLPGSQESTGTDNNLRTREISLSLTETALAHQVQLALTQQSPANSIPTTGDVPPLQIDAAAPAAHTLTPGEPGWVSRELLDPDSGENASQNSAAAGDDLGVNLFERPFSQSGMDYRPDLDIRKAELSLDSNFYYVSVSLAGAHPQSNDLSQAAYAVELDTDLDGRGDYLVWADGPCGSSWDTAGVLVYEDSNNDVGAVRPVLPDAPANGDGYDRLVFSPENLSDADASWCRQVPDSQVWMAFKKSIIGDAEKFLWSAWADAGTRDPKKFDYNDSYTLEQAGSPIKDHPNYPIKALFLVDNTCRETFGYEPVGDEPGLCPQLQATVTQSATVTGTSQVVPSATSTKIFIPINTPTPGISVR